MTKLIPLFLFIAALIAMSFIIDRRTKKKVVFFGDSITQAGMQPKGYITVLNQKLQDNNINNYDLIGTGIGGNKVYDLYLRMEDDVISKKPDIVVIFAGVNDVWHRHTYGTDADEFEKFYRAMITKLQAAGSNVVVCTPAAIGEKNDYSNELDGDLNRYSNIIRTIADDLQVPLVDLRKKFMDYELKNNPTNADEGILTTDGVHLNDMGNEFVADAMWEVLKKIK